MVNDRFATIDELAKIYRVGRYDGRLQSQPYMRLIAAAVGGISVLLVATLFLSLII